MNGEHDDNLDERYADRDYRFKDAIGSDIRPKLPGDESRTKDAQQALAGAERNASNPANPIDDKSTAGSSNQAEKAIPSSPPPPPPPGDPPSHINNVKGDQRWDKNSPFNKSFPQIGVPRQMMKKFGPVGLIGGLIIAGALAIFGSQAILPFHVIEMLTEDFGSLEVGNDIRAKNLTGNMIGEANTPNPVQSKLIPFTGIKFKKMKAGAVRRLSGEGITFVNKGVVPDLTIKEMNASPSYAKAIDPDTGALTQKVMIYNDGTSKRLVTADEFESLYNSDPNFRNGYRKGARTWAGRISGWFDKQIAKLLKKFKLDRNLFKNWVADVDAREAGNAALNNTLATAGAGDAGATADDDVKSKSESAEEGGDDREPAKGSDNNGLEGERSTKKLSQKRQNAAENLTALKGTLGKVAAVMGVVNAACGIFLGLSAISMMVAAANLLQIVTSATAMAESVDKGKAGYGSESPINEYANKLTEVVPLKTVEANVDTDNVTFTDSTTEAKSAMESTGMMWSMTGSPVDLNDSSAKAFNQESGMSDFSLGGGVLQNSVNVLKNAFKATVSFFKTCLILQATNAAISLTISVVGLAIGAVTGGIGTFVIEGLKSAAIPLVMAIALPAIGAALMAKLVDRLTMSVEDATGVDFGNMTAAGMHAYDAGNHRQSGGGGGSKSAVLAFRREQREVIAMNAELDRQSHSPFDATNKNTFLGSILFKTLPFFGKFPTLSNTLSTLGGLTTRSVSTLLPTANALDDVELNDNIGSCPQLESVGAIGDIYCQPYMISDVTTKKIPPETIFQNVYQSNWIVENKYLTGPQPAEPKELGSTEGETFAIVKSRTDNYNAHDYDSATLGDPNNWGQGWAWSGSGDYYARRHNFKLETDICDEQSFDRTYMYYYNGKPSSKTSYGKCLDRAAIDGIDNIVPASHTGSVELPVMTLITYDDTVYAETMAQYDTSTLTNLESLPIETLKKLANDDRIRMVPPYGDGNEQIMPKSNLMFYIEFCTQRYTPGGYAPYGVVDDNVASVYEKPPSTIASSLPFGIGDAVDIIGAIKKQEIIKTGWMEGLNCIANNTGDLPDSYVRGGYDFSGDQGQYDNDISSMNPDYKDRWNKELVYYQQYLEDARIIENTTGEPSSLSAYMDWRDEVMPQDTSYEGILASLSGQQKEQVAEILAVIKDYKDGKFDPYYVASLFPTPRGWGSAEDHSIEELEIKKTVLAKALNKIVATQQSSVSAFSENRRKVAVDLV